MKKLNFARYIMIACFFQLLNCCGSQKSKDLNISQKINISKMNLSIEVPPWGEKDIKSQIWEEGRKIFNNPTNLPMDKVYIELGFYDSSREDMMDWLSKKENIANHLVIKDNEFRIDATASNPKLVIQRTYKKGQMNLEVIVTNSAGWNTSSVWRYIITYSHNKKRWLFNEIHLLP